ncbi:MAG: LysR substrate-binding domain-containing protein [Tagaea sp.]|nr:LysR substrate-binding domain-containing protein [Tagaea sp.]
MRRLPYLNGLRAFEAVARGRSIAAASAELGVAPAAVSRMVKLLEARIGFALFARGPNRLVLTTAGGAYRDGLTEIFDRLVDLTDRAASLARHPILTIGAGPTFASRWLIPRLSSLRKAVPGVDVRVTAGGIAAPFADDWTCGIRLGDGNWPGLVAVPLFAAELSPVASPAFAKRLRDPADLSRVPLLRVAHSPDDWRLWAEAAGIPAPSAAGPTFEYYGQALQAAADGVGVAMGVTPYIDDDLATGRLAAPFALRAPKHKGWFLVHRARRAGEPAFEAFKAWITSRRAGTRPNRRRPENRHAP